MTLHTSMAEALRLTRMGDLTGATALLRSTLGGSKKPASTIIPAEEAVDLQRKQIPSARLSGGTSAAGRFEARRHARQGAVMDYMLYRPASVAPGLPLVIMLHGCTQTPEDFARGTGMNRLADEMGFLVAYPRQTQTANQQRCWNWFRPGDQARGEGEPALIAGVAQDVIAAEGADPGRVYVAGLSAGGAAAAIMADAYPDLFAAVGVHSGLACGAARDLPGALNAMKTGGVRRSRPRSTASRFVPVITFHGDRDGIVHERNAQAIVETAIAATGVRVTVDIERGKAGGRSFTRALSRDGAGRVLVEQWTVSGAGHAWSGGDPAGSYADAAGPDASRAMLRFFMQHRTSKPSI
jgi:poly(hydroxyalkanoate) depolymerase family esterase